MVKNLGGEEEEKVVELRSGVIPAAGYARKLRRVALAALSRIAPRDVIIRDVSELNKQLYKIIVEERKYDKTDLIRIVIEAKYDPSERRIVFGEPKIDRFLPESKLKEMVEESVKELREKYEKEIIELKGKYKKEVEQLEKKIYEITESCDEKVKRVKEEYEKRITELRHEVSELKRVIEDIKGVIAGVFS